MDSEALMANKEIAKWLQSLKLEIGEQSNQRLWHYEEALDMAIKALEQTQWIPCSERLPKIEREGQRRCWYLTTNEYGNVGMTQYEFYNDLLETGWRSNYRIVAWMPLPEPWKGENDD